MKRQAVIEALFDKLLYTLHVFRGKIGPQLNDNAPILQIEVECIFRASGAGTRACQGKSRYQHCREKAETQSLKTFADDCLTHFERVKPYRGGNGAATMKPGISA